LRLHEEAVVVNIVNEVRRTLHSIGETPTRPFSIRF
jgi:hypothetical protein